MASEPPPYPQSTLVLCKHTDNLYYEAKVIKVTKNKIGEWIYRLHYTGWNVRYDENIKHSDTPSRFMAYTPDNIEMTKQQKHSAIALSKGAAKRKRRTYEDEGTSSVQSSNVSTAEQPTKFTKPPIPSRIIFMLQNVRNVPNLEEKTSVDEFLKKYVKDNKKNFEKIYPNHPQPEELVTTLTEQIKLDFNMNLLTYLTQGEMKQCLSIFNKKRTDQDESELTMEEMKEMYENKDSRIELFNNPGIDFSDTYGVLHFARFLKAGYNYYGNEVTGFEKFYVTFFHDLLSFAENFSSEYT